MFLRYLSDMKVLQMELCDGKGCCMAKANLNFQLIKHWGGDKEEITVEIKNNKQSKIG